MRMKMVSGRIMMTMQTMRMVMAMAMGVVMIMGTMRMIMVMTMRMAVTRVSFTRTRKVVDKWDGHWGLHQLLLSIYAFVLDRPVNP